MIFILCTSPASFSTSYQSTMIPTLVENVKKIMYIMCTVVIIDFICYIVIGFSSFMIPLPEHLKSKYNNDLVNPFFYLKWLFY